MRTEPLAATRERFDAMGAPTELVALAPGAEPVRIERVEELISAETSLWERLKATLHQNFRELDRLLLRLHYRRGASLPALERGRILRFLAAAYLITRDVRYYNEFLWFDRPDAGPYGPLCRRAFEANLIDGAHHVFPLATPGEVDAHVQRVRHERTSAPEERQRLRVALLGAPFSFTGVHRGLAELGCEPSVYFLPAGERRRLRRWVKSNTLATRMACWGKGCFLPYRRLPLAPDDPALGAVLASGRHDLAIHKLGFIIKRNLIEQFRLGILNDHLGVLPFVRGRSSIEFSLLFGFQAGATIHFIDEGVDTGPLLDIHSYSLHGARTVAAVKKMVLARSDDRFVDAVAHLLQRAYRPVENAPEAGLQYFTMHPDLVAHVETRVIPRRHRSGGDEETLSREESKI